MGRKSRHSARTGNGGAELRLQKKQLKNKEKEAREAELTFYDDPSDNDINASGNVSSDTEDFEMDSNDEVLQLNENSDSEGASNTDVYDSDENLVNEEARINNLSTQWSKAGSKKAGIFHSADTAEYDPEEDENIALDEEKAALELQRKEAETIDDADYGIDNESEDERLTDTSQERQDNDEETIDDEAAVGAQLDSITMLSELDDGTAVERLTKDFSKLTKSEKLKLVNESAPELLGLIEEMKTSLSELRTEIIPAIQKLKIPVRTNKQLSNGFRYLITRQNLLLNYIGNISFYFLLRAEGKSVVNHPVLKQLLLIKNQLIDFEVVRKDNMDKLQELLNSDPSVFTTKESVTKPEEEDGLSQFINGTKDKINSKSTKREPTESLSTSKSKKMKHLDNLSHNEKIEALEFYEAAAKAKQQLKSAKDAYYTPEPRVMMESDNDENDDAKRGASYEMMKNKGLKAHKNKLNRNPRVKKRMQFRKALIRRKGQVRDVRVGEAGQYGGETTGIKTNLSRSRKIRN